MTLFYAHYPSLEQSFLRFTRENRGPLEPWLIVCASSFLAKHLREELVHTQGAVANIHFCTASALLYQLDSEGGTALPVFPQNHLRDFLLKDILSEPGLNEYPLSRGFIGALKSALRDLADSLVDVDILEEQLRTSADENVNQDKERFSWLVRVYKRYLEREAALPNYRPYQAFFERALAHVENSTYLKQFSKIIWYGFYDMPGRQLELLNTVRAHYPLTVFAPYEKIPAYQFARKFFETNWLGNFGGGLDENTKDFGALGKSAPYLFSPQGDEDTPNVHLVCAAETSGEIFFAAKEILRLVEQEKYNFSDMGVLARTQVPYQDELRRVFAQNQIPLQASFSSPLTKYPLGIFCLNLFTLRTNNFEREQVLALVSSPYFRATEKRAWRKLITKSLVNLNLSQWQDLLPQTDGFDPAFLTWLEHCNTQLKDLVSAGTWTEKCTKAVSFLAENIDEDTLQEKELSLYQSIRACITSLTDFDSLRSTCHEGEFTRELTEALSTLSFNEVSNVPRGVLFTDVLHARGLRFKIVFLLGVNEKVFPQLLSEDPILRDRYRYILRDTLGYWINQKSEQTQEERLLFFNACTTATDKLYVSYAKRGMDGKEIVPSVYIAELARATRQNWTAEATPQVGVHLSRQLAQVETAFFTPKEISYTLLINGEPTEKEWLCAELLTPDILRQTHAAQMLKSRGRAGAFDGLIQSGLAIYEHEQHHGFSPSALQDLAACPMRYFFRKGLHLADKEDVYSRYELAANTRGTLYHRVLEEFYRELERLHFTHQLFDTAVAEYMDRTLAQFCTVQTYRKFGIYPVVWELLLEQMRTCLIDFAQQDVKQLGPFTPTYFERAFEKVTLPNFPFVLRGIIDRIDVDTTNKQFIVADYKSSRKGTKDLAQTFFTHLIFQPFLYILAAQTLPELKDFSSAGSCLLVFQKYNRRELSPEVFSALRPKAENFFNLLAKLVKEGTFILNTSESCTYCQYGAICRKDSFSCLMRARKSESSEQLKEARDVH